MRSRALQPRSIFRIATTSASSSSSSSSSSPASLAAAATAPARPIIVPSSPATGTRQSSHVPPSRPLNRSRRTARAATASTSTGVTASAPAVASPSTLSPHVPTTATPSSLSRGLPAPPSSHHPFSHPVVPVLPPPHTRTSVGLQSFFSQGRPLLEHHNILQSSGANSPFSALGGASSDNGPHPAMVGVAMVIPPDLDGDGGAAGVEEQSGGTPAEATLLRNQRLPQGLEAHIKAKAQVLLEQMKSLREELANASPQQRQKMLASVGGSAQELLPADLKQVQQNLLSLSPGTLTFQLHLPALQSIPPAAFNRMIETITSSSSSSSSLSRSALSSSPSPFDPKDNNPLSLYTRILTMQQFESDRQQSIKQALERGEDPSLASALGPEGDLVVLGEPEGPRKEWGRGVTSYLARMGKPFCPPSAPAKGQEAARTKGLDDLLTYHVSTDEAELSQEGEVIEIREGDAEESTAGRPHQSIAELIAEHHATAGEETISFGTSDGAFSGPSGDADDLNLWLGHAMVQEKLKAQVQWDGLVRQMNAASLQQHPHEQGGAARQASLPSAAPIDVRRLRITLPLDAPRSKGRVGQGGQSEGEGAGAIVEMDSVRRKKRKKMNKMKYKKLRKRQRSERQRMKK